MINPPFNIELEFKRMKESITTLHRKINLVDQKLTRHMKKEKQDD